MLRVPLVVHKDVRRSRNRESLPSCAGERLDTVATPATPILLLCGGDKATQQRDIERAYQLAEEYWREEGRDHG